MAIFPLWRSNSAFWPAALLIVALSSVFWFGHDRGHFYRPVHAATSDAPPDVSIHNWASAKNLTLAANLSWRSGLRLFFSQYANPGGDPDPMRKYYGSFPLGGYALIKLAMVPFSDDLTAMTVAARMLMLLFFSAAALLAYDAIGKVLRDRWIAVTAVALAFSSYFCLYHNDAVDNEGSVDLFAVMFAFHGMVLYALRGRFRQLLIKTAIAALLGWHVFAFLLPFVAVGLCRDFVRAKADGSPVKDAFVAVVRSPFAIVGVAALAVGGAALGWNFLHQHWGYGGTTPLDDYQITWTLLRRTGLVDLYTADLQWWPFLQGQFHRIGEMMAVPYVLSAPLSAAAFTAQEATGIEFNFFAVCGMVATACVLSGLIVVFCYGEAARKPSAFRVVWLLGVLAVSGFVWSLPMRGNTAIHVYEVLFYIGLTLVLFSLAALAVRRLCGGRASVCVAVLAVGTFAWSAHRMSSVGHDAASAHRQRALVRDFETIRRLTRGKANVCVSSHFSRESRWSHYAIAYYLAGSNFGSNILNRRRIEPACPGGIDVGYYVLSSKRQVEDAAVLTPDNELAFLHTYSSKMESPFVAEYRALVSSEPQFRSDVDGYLKNGRLYFLKEPCAADDVAMRFWVALVPPLSLVTRVLPPHRQRFGSRNAGLVLMFDGQDKCMGSIPLPAWTDVVSTGTATSRMWVGKVPAESRRPAQPLAPVPL